MIFNHFTRKSEWEPGGSHQIRSITIIIGITIVLCDDWSKVTKGTMKVSKVLTQLMHKNLKMVYGVVQYDGDYYFSDNTA